MKRNKKAAHFVKRHRAWHTHTHTKNGANFYFGPVGRACLNSFNWERCSIWQAKCVRLCYIYKSVHIATLCACKQCEALPNSHTKYLSSRNLHLLFVIFVSIDASHLFGPNDISRVFFVCFPFRSHPYWIFLVFTFVSTKASITHNSMTSRKRKWSKNEAKKKNTNQLNPNRKVFFVENETRFLALKIVHKRWKWNNCKYKL